MKTHQHQFLLCHWLTGGTQVQRQMGSVFTDYTGWIFCFFIKVRSLVLSFIFCSLARKHIWFRYLPKRNHIKFLMSSHLKISQHFFKIVSIRYPQVFMKRVKGYVGCITTDTFQMFSWIKRRQNTLKNFFNLHVTKNLCSFQRVCFIIGGILASIQTWYF